MTAMTHEQTDAHPHPHSLLWTLGFVVLFWIGAAFLVAWAHLRLDAISPILGTAAAIATLLLAAFAYMRIAAREATVDHALGVGIAWLTMAIVAEIAIAAAVGHGWFAILGSPQRPALRNLFLFVWIFSPSLFARYQNVKGEL